MIDLDKIARDALRQAGVSRWWINRFRTEIVTVLIVVAVAAGCVGGYEKDKLTTIWPLLVATPATLGFVLGYLQWRAGNHEASFEQYFSRLKDANALFSAYRVERIKAQATVPPGGKTEGSLAVADHLQTMFNFAELDNLEYMLGKLRLGYVRQGLAVRMVRAFVSRCLEDRDGFRNNMLYWIGEGDRQAKAGYDRPTRLLVRYVVRETQPSEPV